MSPRSDVSLRTAVKEHILTGHPITEITCLVLFGVPNLFSVISDRSGDLRDATAKAVVDTAN